MAPRYLIDTNICIYISKHRPPEVLDHFSRLQAGEVAMSLITYGELRYGAEKSRHRDLALEKLAGLAELVPVLQMDAEVARHYGNIRSALARSGTPIGANDLWIAAHARAAGLVLVSNNLSEFDRVEGLKTENWVTQ